MKALSLWQPWASAVAVGAKRIETRSWRTAYRGPLAIHAAKHYTKYALIHYACHWSWCGALRPLGLSMGDYKPLWELLPFGAIVAVCDLVDCRPTGGFTQEELDTPSRPKGETGPMYDWTERHMGNFALGRFGWVLDNVKALETPIPCRGRQGLFNVDPIPDSCLLTSAPEAR